MNTEQKLILAHVVVDPDAWYKHAIATFGETVAKVHLEEKVERHRAAYEEESALPGYKNRAEREIEINN